MSRSRHVAIVSIPAHGHINPTLAVVEELQRRGHRVSYCVRDELAGKVARTGAEVVAASRPAPAGLHPDPSRGEAEEFYLKPFEDSISALPTYREHFDEDPPDIVLFDMLAIPPGLALARRYDVPATTLFPTFASGPGYSLLGTIAKRTGVPMDVVPDFFRERIERFFNDEKMTEVAVEDITTMQTDRALAFFPRVFQPAGDTFGDGHAFVGPCLARRDFQGSWTPPAPDRPLLLVSVGTVNELHRELLDSLVTAFADTEWQVVVATGKHSEVADGLTPPPNIEVRPSVPQLEVLRHASLMITHAGMGGVMEAAANGVPMLTLPATPEQDLVAERVTELGVGRPLGTAGDDPVELRELVQKTAADATVAAGLSMLRTEIENAGGTVRAADVIERQLAG